MAYRGLFESIGAIADSLHRSLGLNTIAWGWRMVMAFFLVDMVDIVLRAITLPLLFAFPLISHAAHIIFNTILAFACAALWGAPGLLHLIDVLFGLLPGVGGDILLDILPIATIAGFIALWREEEHRPAPEQGGSMIGIALWFFTGTAMWWFGCVSILSYGWIFTTALCFPGIWLVTQYAPSKVVAGIVFVLALTIGFRLAYLSIVSPESYREKTWITLETMGDPRITATQETDRAAILATRGYTVAAEIAEKAASTASKAASGLSSEVGKKVGSVLKSVESDVPAWNNFAHWLGDKLVPNVSVGKKKEPAVQNQETVAEQKKTPLIKVGGRELSTRETALYTSDYVLQKAKEFREERICWAKNVFFLMLGLLLFAVTRFSSDISNSAELRNVPDEDPDI